MNREIMQQALDHLVALADDLRRIPSDIAQTIAALEAELVNYEEPLPPVDIGVDVTPEGTHVTAFYRRPDAVQEMFYSQFHPLAKPEMPAKIFGPNLEQILNAAGFYRREWVGLTDEEIKEVLDLNVAPWSLSGVALQHVMDDARALEAKLKEKNGG